MLQLLSLAHGFAAPQPFSGPFWNLASQATGPWDQYWWLCKPRHSPATSRRPARPRLSACNWRGSVDWRDGGKSTCAPGHAKYQMAVVSRAEKDGAYGDDHSASIEIYKQAACTYWYLDNDQVLRWYMLTYAGCRAVLAGTAPRGRPDSPDAQFAAYGDQMAGMAVLVDSCADDPTQCEACAWPGGGRGAGGECTGSK